MPLHLLAALLSQAPTSSLSSGLVLTHGPRVHVVEGEDLVAPWGRPLIAWLQERLKQGCQRTDGVFLNREAGRGGGQPELSQCIDTDMGASRAPSGHLEPFWRFVPLLQYFKGLLLLVFK